jgi:hypothetical protein
MKCEYEHEEYGILCAAFEFDIEKWLEITEEYKTLDEYTIIERTVVCIHCGQTDVDYPV